ncbi:MAG: PEP-CTERM sorting domain-containing protein [Verrucomicrobiota bacterium]
MRNAIPYLLLLATAQSLPAVMNLYEIDASGVATKSPFLDVDIGAFATWILEDGDTLSGTPISGSVDVTGLDPGDSLVTISTSSLTNILAFSNDGDLYQITTAGVASKPAFLDVDFGAFAAWILEDGDTLSGTPISGSVDVTGLDPGDSLTDISTSSAGFVVAYSNDGDIYQITTTGVASKYSFLDVDFGAVDSWILVDGDTLFGTSVFGNLDVTGLDPGDSLISISSSDGSTVYAFAIPEPQSALLFGLSISVFVTLRRRIKQTEQGTVNQH